MAIAFSLAMTWLVLGGLDAGSRQEATVSNSEAARLIEKLGTSDEERVSARHALAAMGREAIPALIEACRASQKRLDILGRDTADDDIDEWDTEAARQADIASILSMIGEPAIPVLSALIQEEDSCRRTWLMALDSIARESVSLRLEPPPPGLSHAVPQVIAALDDPDRMVRWAAVRALAAFPVEGTQAAVPGLIRVLTDEGVESEGLRRDAADALGRMGELATPAEPALERARSGPERLLAAAAEEALRKIRAAARSKAPGIKGTPCP